MEGATSGEKREAKGEIIKYSQKGVTIAIMNRIGLGWVLSGLQYSLLTLFASTHIIAIIRHG
jgi:hypothetical protein